MTIAKTERQQSIMTALKHRHRKKVRHVSVVPGSRTFERMCDEAYDDVEYFKDMCRVINGEKSRADNHADEVRRLRRVVSDLEDRLQKRQDILDDALDLISRTLRTNEA